MKAAFGVVGLLVVVAIVGLLAKKQLTAAGAPAATGAPAAVTPQQQVQQFQKAAESAMQQARPLPEEPK
ncbi:hypothetical protein H8N03_11095 [Ramlibacter sp. USB13]|uniref:Uncharacterized protein n=1 Tax=Ramlibacter cellulosilyticus TaxID=2764187 RepID=A0A923SB51_9BURK|nr:hypothetical protein [Ramlibacter cellulosilyticus]MBC5783491.1 hypothetical protein [Ramlibacter cellulosilyticus]